MKNNQFLGIATISLWAGDHTSAVKWYTELFSQEPYFSRPGYAEFRVGDYEVEVGIIDSSYAPKGLNTTRGSGAVMYWQVTDVNEVYSRILTMGATALEAPKDRGNDFTTASAVDPFGNIIGIMYNPHYLKVSSMNR